MGQMGKDDMSSLGRTFRLFLGSTVSDEAQFAYREECPTARNVQR